MNFGKEPRRRKTAIATIVSFASGTIMSRQCTYRAKAKIIRLLVVITLRMARIKHTRGSLRIC